MGLFSIAICNSEKSFVTLRYRHYKWERATTITVAIVGRVINGGNREKMPWIIIIIVVAIVGKAITVYGPMQNEAKFKEHKIYGKQ